MLTLRLNASYAYSPVFPNSAICRRCHFWRDHFNNLACPFVGYLVNERVELAIKVKIDRLAAYKLAFEDSLVNIENPFAFAALGRVCREDRQSAFVCRSLDQVDQDFFGIFWASFRNPMSQRPRFVVSGSSAETLISTEPFRNVA